MQKRPKKKSPRRNISGRRVGKKAKFGKPDSVFGRLKGVIKIVGDITSPLVPPEDWEYD